MLFSYFILSHAAVVGNSPGDCFGDIELIVRDMLYYKRNMRRPLSGNGGGQ